MIFVDVFVSERKGKADQFTAKLLLKDNASLHEAVTAALCKFKFSPFVSASVFGSISTEVLLSRVKSIMCAATDLFDYLNEPEAKINLMDSDASPIMKSGIHIHLNQMEVQAEEPAAKKPKQTIDDKLMEWTPAKLSYVGPPLCKTGEEMRLNNQIFRELCNLFELQKLGYCNGAQMMLLEKNRGHLVSALCFVEKNWSGLFRCSFPKVPAGKYNSLELLKSLGNTKRQ